MEFRFGKNLAYKEHHENCLRNKTRIFYPTPISPGCFQGYTNFPTVFPSSHPYHFITNQSHCLKSEIRNSFTPHHEERILSNSSNESIVSEAVSVVDRSNEEYACTVNALLAHPGYHDRKYDVTLEELKRRVSAPESLNKVDMIAYLRMAKTKARVFLKSKNIQLMKQNRKARHSVLTKLCEQECQELAKGIHSLNEKYFPVSDIAKQFVDDQRQAYGQELSNTQLKSTRSLLRSLRTLIDGDKRLKSLEDYDRTTHTFGRKNLSNTLRLLQTIIDEIATETNQQRQTELHK